MRLVGYLKRYLLGCSVKFGKIFMLQIFMVDIESRGLHTATYTVTYHEKINKNKVHIFITVFTICTTVLNSYE
jgi:hypothetical protein